MKNDHSIVKTINGRKYKVVKENGRLRLKVIKDNKRRNITLAVYILFILIIIFLLVSVVRGFNKEKIESSTVKESISTTESIDESNSISESEEPLFVFDRQGNIIDTTDEEPETTEAVDHTKEITSTQYTLGEGVRARLLPSNDGDILKVIYDIYSPVGVISEGTDWYTCCIDNTICYINARYIGNEEDVEYVKDKRAKQAALEEKRKSSAYYTIFQNMTDEEYELLAKIVALEAGNQSFEGKVAVIEVILNRCISRNPTWPNDIKSVIYQKGQFATVKYLSHPYAYPGDSEYDAIDYVKDNGATVIRSYLDKQGYDNISSLDYTFFATYHANGASPVIKIGGHYFARESNKKYQRSRK